MRPIRQESRAAKHGQQERPTGTANRNRQRERPTWRNRAAIPYKGYADVKALPVMPFVMGRAGHAIMARPSDSRALVFTEMGCCQALDVRALEGFAAGALPSAAMRASNSASS